MARAAGQIMHDTGAAGGAPFSTGRGRGGTAGWQSLARAGVVQFPRCARTAFLSCVILLPASDAALAQQAGPPGPQRESNRLHCVTVQAGGERAGTLNCASQTLQAAARVAQARARAGNDVEVHGATSSDIHTGVASQSATRQRMGNSFGTSVRPQRPGIPPPAPRPGASR